MTKDPTHIPDNVQAVLKGLPVKDQVVLRAYIASLREHVKGLEHKLLAAEGGDEHAHYHGKALRMHPAIIRIQPSSPKPPQKDALWNEVPFLRILLFD